MMKPYISKTILILSFVFAVSTWIQANNLQITNITFDDSNNTLNFDVSWDNAFYINTSLSDQIYIFAKFKNANASNWETVLFETSGHSDDQPLMVFGSAGTTLVNGFPIAVRAYNAFDFDSGTQSGNCTAQMAYSNLFVNPSFKVFGIEMVSMNTNGGDYYVGDGTSENRWHKGNDSTKAYFWDLSVGAGVDVGNGANEINTTHPDGIPVSSIPAHIFKTNQLIMKYEISQIQYVEFLNCLNRTAQNNRVATDISGTSITDVYVMTQSPDVAGYTRNGVRCDSILPNGGPVVFYCDYNGNGIPNEYDDGQNIAMNFLSGEDLFAYLDWAGLSPLNEIQYESICRGSNTPVPNEFAWGTSGYTNVNINSGPTNGSPDEYLNATPVDGPMRSSQSPMRCGAAATATTNRVTSGASAFGHMDLSGNVAELVIALRSSNSFNTNMDGGDGTLDIFGNANTNWVKEVVGKGFYQNVPDGAHSVSRRFLVGSPFTARSAFYGGRGGY